MAGLSALVALLALLFVAGAVDAEESVAVPVRLTEAIRRLHPAAGIVTADEIVGERCGADQQREQIFRADFDGDGRPDYATLLRIGEPAGKPDEMLRTVPLWGVVFFANRDGRYRPFILFKDDDAMFPSRRVLWIQPTGPVRHGVHPERVLTLRHPAVGSMLCQSTAKVFYWVSHRLTFREYPTKE